MILLSWVLKLTHVSRYIFFIITNMGLFFNIKYAKILNHWHPWPCRVKLFVKALTCLVEGMV